MDDSHGMDDIYPLLIVYAEQLEETLEEGVTFGHVRVPVANDNSITVYMQEPNEQYRVIDMFQESFSQHVYLHAIVHIFLDLDVMRIYSLLGGLKDTLGIKKYSILHACVKNLRSVICMTGYTRTDKWQNMSISISKGSHSLSMSPESSTPTSPFVSERMPQSQSEPMIQPLNNSTSILTGKHVPQNELVLGEPPSRPLNAGRSVSSTSLQSKVAPESLLESLNQPLRKVIHISRTDLNVFITVLEQYKRHIECIANRL